LAILRDLDMTFDRARVNCILNFSPLISMHRSLFSGIATAPYLKIRASSIKFVGLNQVVDFNCVISRYTVEHYVNIATRFK
jgi:hypothetical protein